MFSIWIELYRLSWLIGKCGKRKSLWLCQFEFALRSVFMDHTVMGGPAEYIYRVTFFLQRIYLTDVPVRPVKTQANQLRSDDIEFQFWHRKYLIDWVPSSNRSHRTPRRHDWLLRELRSNAKSSTHFKYFRLLSSHSSSKTCGTASGEFAQADDGYELMLLMFKLPRRSGR